MTLAEAAPAGAGRRAAVAGIGLLVSALLLWWSLRGVDLGAVRARIGEARPLPLAAAVLLATLMFPLRALRWRLLLDAPGPRPLPFGPAWHATAVGFMANNLLPLRAGEVARALVVSRLAGPPVATALASLAVERLLDGLTLVLCFGLGLVAARLPAGSSVGGVPLDRLTSGAGALALGALVAGLVVARMPDAFARLVRRLVPAPALAERLVALATAVQAGLGALRTPGRLALAGAASLAVWGAGILSFLVAARAFGIPLDLAGAAVLQGIVAIGVAVPSSPGYVGAFEATIVAGLALFAVPRELAFSYGLAYHATTFVPITLLGLASLAQSGLSWGAMRGAPA
ncbi:MAG: lysylphosphatidylglycerol synthase transmembrane domain-containing protein [Gemmatimonadales bacterium]|nr:lysylphosphatidylglycerol synthase transmembrane domain-containing protein [Gemmatimonadales bacterium]